MKLPVASYQLPVLLCLVVGCASETHPQHATTRPTSQPKSVETAVKGAQKAFKDADPETVTRVTQQIFPAVVRLDVAQEIYSDGKRNLRRGIGSGVIIDDDGRILTNYHVAGRAAEILVTLANKERVPAKLIGDDHWTDLAI